MQAEFSGGKFFFYKRKGFEVVQRYADGGLFAESAAFFMIKMAVGGLEFGVFDDIDPVVDKRMVVLAVVNQGSDAATVRVAENDDIFDLQMIDCILNGGGSAVTAAQVMFVGRDDVGNIADNEKVARFGAENYRRVDPGVTAGDDQNLGRLSFLMKPAIKFGVVDKYFGGKSGVRRAGG